VNSVKVIWHWKKKRYVTKTQQKTKTGKSRYEKTACERGEGGKPKEGRGEKTVNAKPKGKRKRVMSQTGRKIHRAGAKIVLVGRRTIREGERKLNQRNQSQRPQATPRPAGMERGDSRKSGHVYGRKTQTLCYTEGKKKLVACTHI